MSKDQVQHFRQPIRYKIITNTSIFAVKKTSPKVINSNTGWGTSGAKNTNHKICFFKGKENHQ